MDLFVVKIAYASRLDTFLANVNSMIVKPLIGFLFALAVLYFLYGMAQFIFSQDNDEKRTVGKSHMVWGIVGITIMMGVWVILGMLLDTFNITNVDPESGTVNLD